MSRIKSIGSLLTGYVTVHNNLVLYLQDHIVVDQRNKINDASQVKLISGGGSGHEPAHTGYVGTGMLTTSVCGELYASPSVKQILNAILITGTPSTSILLIVKNYTGDRLNFGLALEIAKYRYNYKNIDMVIINDDISIDDNRVQESVGRRGLAGTVLYHKIIGALAAKKKPLNEIVSYTNHLLANNAICTVGFTCKLGANTIHDIEIGKGIHGEPGAEFINSLDDFEKIYDILLAKFQKNIPYKSSVIVMVNNLGGTSQFTMNIFVNGLVEKISNIYNIGKIYSGSFLTSLNSEGISVTLLNLSNDNHSSEIIECLAHVTNVPCNIFEVNGDGEVASEKSEIITTIEQRDADQELIWTSHFPKESDHILFKNIVTHCARAIIENVDLLNEMDSEYGDGDTGDTLALFANQIEIEIGSGAIKCFNNPKMILQQLSDLAQNFVGGTTGVLYCLFLQAMSSSIADDATVDLKVWTIGIKAGIKAIQKYGRSKKGDRTLLEPLITCAKALDNFQGMEVLNELCDQSVQATKNLIPKSGRAAYTFSMDTTARKSNYPDPGAKAIGIIVNAISAEICNFK